MEHVILVDEQDRPKGTMEKLEAHQKGELHRAFSILLFNSNGELLIQKRSQSKYHSGGLWTNTCCSHPLPQEQISEAARRKLMQEMGIDLQPEFAFKFQYKVSLDNALIEHEIDHVLTGNFDGEPILNPEEAEDWKFVAVDELREDIKVNPHLYTHWFKIILEHPQFERVLV